MFLSFSDYLVCADLGPYTIRYLSNGRYMLLGGQKGHVAMMDVLNLESVKEFQVCMIYWSYCLWVQPQHSHTNRSFFSENLFSRLEKEWEMWCSYRMTNFMLLLKKSMESFIFNPCLSFWGLITIAQALPRAQLPVVLCHITLSSSSSICDILKC